jgi:hypothetical protein
MGKSTNPLDLFHLLLEQRILVCRSCKAGVAPRHLVTQIRAHHRGLYSAFQTKQSSIEWVQDRLLPSLPCALLDPVVESIPVPPADAKAFPVLKVHVGYGCTYCPAVSKSEDQIRKHYNARHASVRRGRGGAVANSRGMMQKRLNREHYGDQPLYPPASYQRFFTAGVKGSICFRITAPERPAQGATSLVHGSLPRSDGGQFVMTRSSAPLPASKRHSPMSSVLPLLLSSRRRCRRGSREPVGCTGCPINKHFHKQALVWTLINEQTGDLKTLNCSKQTR